MKEIIVLSIIVGIMIIGIILNINRDIEKMSRQQKRNAKIIVNGKSMNVLEYIKRVSVELPVMYHRVSNKPLDHYRRMKDIYMKRGRIEDVESYVKVILKKANKELKNRTK